jgi:hypothetical protein
LPVSRERARFSCGFFSELVNDTLHTLFSNKKNIKHLKKNDRLLIVDCFFFSVVTGDWLWNWPGWAGLGGIGLDRSGRDL